MGGIGECVLSIECVVTRVKHTDPKVRFWSVTKGYMALWADVGVIWWLRVLSEVQVRDWWYCVIHIGD